VAASKLADLSSFHRIVVDASALVNNGDLAAVKTHITDLKTSWDDAWPYLKSRSAAEWHTVDQPIDLALAASRASAPDAATARSR
jgi:hypothetical protein